MVWREDIYKVAAAGSGRSSDGFAFCLTLTFLYHSAKSFLPTPAQRACVICFCLTWRRLLLRKQGGRRGATARALAGSCLMVNIAAGAVRLLRAYLHARVAFHTRAYVVNTFLLYARQGGEGQEEEDCDALPVVGAGGVTALQTFRAVQAVAEGSWTVWRANDVGRWTCWWSLVEDRE